MSWFCSTILGDTSCNNNNNNNKKLVKKDIMNTPKKLLAPTKLSPKNGILNEKYYLETYSASLLDTYMHLPS
jgi:hypothetical protein